MDSQELPKMSLVAQCDDLFRYTGVLTSGCEKEFKTFVETQLNSLLKKKESEFEIRKLKEKISGLESENGRMDTKIKHLKDLLKEAVLTRQKVESEKSSLARQIAIIKEVLLADGVVDNQTKEKLVFLSSISPPRLQTIEESAGSLFSLSDIDQTDDDLENVRRSSNRRRRRSREKRSSSESRASFKKKKLDDTEQPKVNERKNVIVERCNSEPTSSASDIPTMFHQEHHSNSTHSKYNTYDLRKPYTRSISVSTPTNQHSAGEKVSRSHEFASKTFINRVKCYPCGHNIGYLKQALRCQNCRMVCHIECKEKCPTPCIPLVNTPTKGTAGTIADYASTASPMIPPLIVHCINEIESRGLNTVGLYRVSGSEREVKSLKDKLINGRTFPCLNNIDDIHVICGTVKEFLRSLKEPLITSNAWQSFVNAAEMRDKVLSANALYEIVVDLPQPNRDTLSFIIIHLQKVAESPDCKMSIENLATVFGPTLIGYSADMNFLSETPQQRLVMQRLLSISSDSWQNLLGIDLNQFQNMVKKTPENLPAPKETRLGPIYAQVQKNRNLNARKNQPSPSPRNSKYNKSAKTYFSSPLLK